MARARTSEISGRREEDEGRWDEAEKVVRRRKRGVQRKGSDGDGAEPSPYGYGDTNSLRRQHPQRSAVLRTPRTRPAWCMYNVISQSTDSHRESTVYHTASTHCVPSKYFPELNTR